MESTNEFEDDCSDDDIFLSPDKRRRVRQKECTQRNTISTQGICEELVKKMKSCLNGIPRPPVEPVDVYFTMEDVQLFISSGTLKVEETDSCEKKDSNATERRPHGIYLNIDHSCEELERLGALYIEKYLPCETLSTMSVLTSYPHLTASAKKRRRCNGWASSPGSRLSYLARRKSTFSVDQVSKLGQPASSKQFILQRDQILKGVKSVPLKPKRALFQSPDEDKNNPYRTPDADRRRTMRRLSRPSPRAVRLPSRMHSPQEKKTQRNCRKSLEFASDLNKSVGVTSNESSDKHVKRKLLWAVCTALKGVSVTSSHSKFKMCMNKLFKASLAKWNEEDRERKCCQQNSTSETMLIMAKSLLDKVIIPELHLSKEKQNDVEPCSPLTDKMVLLANNCPTNCTPVKQDDRNENQKETEATVAHSIVHVAEPTNTILFSKQQEPNIDITSTLTCAEQSILQTPVREPDKSPRSTIQEFQSSNHKRKRKDLEEEEEEEIDCFPLCKTAKLLHHYRAGKLTTSGT